MRTQPADGIRPCLGRDKAIPAVLLGCGVLITAACLSFAVAPCCVPLAAILSSRRTSRRLLPGLLWMGIFTYSMVAIPGTPQIQNIILTSFFGTSIWSAPVLGLIGAAYFAAWADRAYRHKNKAKRAKAMVITCLTSRRIAEARRTDGACPDRYSLGQCEP